jgi:NADPH:quinone reductase-like Zn-dependent oxidoreductase
LTRVAIRRCTVIDAPVEAVWAFLRDFNGHEVWHPAVASSMIENGDKSDQVGCIRNFRLKDGSRIREQLLFLSDARRSFGYCILEAQAPLREYVASVRLRPVTDGDACLMEWRAAFEPPATERARLERFVREEIIEGGFAGLRRALREGVQAAPASLSTAAGQARTAVEGVEVAIVRYGGPEVLAPRRASIRAPGPGEARIRQTAIGVNFIDVYCRRGSFDLVAPGGVVGMEAAGVVESVGSGVVNVRPGDRIAYACAPPGAYASIRTMGADLIVRLPPTISDEVAAALLLKGVTAAFLLHDVAALLPGETILVHAAAGGVGRILCRWAKALGATVIGATSSQTKAEEARLVGCDHVAVTSREDFATSVLTFTAGRGVDVVFDAVGKDTFERSVACLAPRGRLVSFGQASGDVGAHSIDQLASRSVTVSRPNYVHYTDTPDKMALQTGRLFGALGSGAVIAERPRSYPLAEAARAHADLEGRRTTGSLILIP